MYKRQVLVFSSNANQSLQIKREVERAVSHGLIIIPLRIEDVAPSPALEYFMSTPHWLEAFTPPLERHLQNLTQVIKDILSQGPEGTKPGEPMSAAKVVAQAGRGRQQSAGKNGRKVLALVLLAIAACGFASWWFISIIHKPVDQEGATAPSPVETPRAPLHVPTPDGAVGSTKPPQVQPVQSRMISLGMELLYIPPGEFLMGSTPEEREWAAANGCGNNWSKYEGEEPRKTIIRQGFWLGKTEVTVGQWRQFANETKYQTEAEKKGWGLIAFSEAVVKGASWRDPKFGFAITDNHPACFISWNDAVAFCAWMTEQERKNGRLPSGFVVRLPTEAEWEYACRAGTQTYFWWGDTKEGGEGRLNRVGKADGFEFVSPVNFYGDRGQNRFGLADMLGNVAEWCLDGFDPARAHEDCFIDNTAKHVIRGGAHDDSIGMNRCAFRFGFPQNFHNFGSGFRVCCGVRTD